MKSMMKLIEQDADSFTKKAELYFQRRPELGNFVEDMHKAYKALAHRYDRITGELQKANQTIAIAFLIRSTLKCKMMRMVALQRQSLR